MGNFWGRCGWIGEVPVVAFGLSTAASSLANELLSKKGTVAYIGAAKARLSFSWAILHILHRCSAFSSPRER